MKNKHFHNEVEAVKVKYSNISKQGIDFQIVEKIAKSCNSINMLTDIRKGYTLISFYHHDLVWFKVIMKRLVFDRSIEFIDLEYINDKCDSDAINNQMNKIKSLLCEAKASLDPKYHVSLLKDINIALEDLEGTILRIKYI